MNNQKKRILALFVAMAFAVGSQAQVFNMGSNGNEGSNNRNGTGSLFTGNITEGFGNSSFYDNGNAEGFGNQEVSPIGSGLFLLAGMAGAYAFMRRKKDEE